MTSKSSVLLAFLLGFLYFSCAENENKPAQDIEKPLPPLSEAKKIKIYPPLPSSGQNASVTSKDSLLEKAKVNTIQPKDTKKKVERHKPQSQTKKKRAFAQASFKNTTYNFDTITAGDIIEYSFIFQNTGNAPLQILEAKASCGCTTPVVPFLDIPPKGENKITVKYNSVNKTGDEEPRIRVKTNGKPEVIVLKLKGHVRPSTKF